jgi:hypothetical protein
MERLGAGEGGAQAIKQHPFFSSVDFDTIWTVEPPALETGIIAPPPRPTRRNIFPDIDWDVSEFVGDELGSEPSSDGDAAPSSRPDVQGNGNVNVNGIASAPNGIGVAYAEDGIGTGGLEPW